MDTYSRNKASTQSIKFTAVEHLFSTCTAHIQHMFSYMGCCTCAEQVLYRYCTGRNYRIISPTASGSY